MDPIRLGQRPAARFGEHKHADSQKVDNSLTSFGKNILKKDSLSKNLSCVLIAILLLYVWFRTLNSTE